MFQPSFVAFLCLLSALVYATRTAWGQYKHHSAGTPALALACISGGLFLFMTIVPGFILLMVGVHYEYTPW
jgi:hypothetical protein